MAMCSVATHVFEKMLADCNGPWGFLVSLITAIIIGLIKPTHFFSNGNTCIYVHSNNIQIFFIFSSSFFMIQLTTTSIQCECLIRHILYHIRMIACLLLLALFIIYPILMYMYNNLQ